MLRAALLVLVFAGLVPQLLAEDKPLTEEQKKRVEELKKQIADKKAEVVKLEAELEKLEPPLHREQAQIPAASRKVMIDAYPAQPKLESFTKGKIGYLETNVLTSVAKVLDERSAVITLRQIAGKNVVKTNYLVTGIDTSNLSDGKEWQLRAVVYVAGSAKTEFGTMTKFIVFEFLPGEIPEAKKDKK